jgi:hypothetical protein
MLMAPGFSRVTKLRDAANTGICPNSVITLDVGVVSPNLRNFQITEAGALYRTWKSTSKKAGHIPRRSNVTARIGLATETSAIAGGLTVEADPCRDV